MLRGIERLLHGDNRPRNTEEFSILEQRTLRLIDYYKDSSAPEVFGELLRFDKRSFPLPSEIMSAFGALNQRGFIQVKDKPKFPEEEFYELTERGKDAVRQVRKHRFANRDVVQVNVITNEPLSVPRR